MLIRRMAFVAALLFLVAAVSGAVVRREEQRTQATAPPRTPAAVVPMVATVDAQLPGDSEVRARVGDIVNIQVRTEEPADVQIPDIGVSDLASADVPGVLEFVADSAGRFPVVATTTGERLGTVVVEPAAG